MGKGRRPRAQVGGRSEEVRPGGRKPRVPRERYKALGGSIQVIHKPGVGHHPHSLADPAPIVEFILSHTDKLNRERIEWCDIWITNADRNDLPRVLLIGDSIVRGYFGDVERALEGRANCARLTTSRCICDPVFFHELKLVLAQYRFDVIHFNNGLHGWGYTEDQYKAAFPRLLNALQQHGRGSTPIWRTTTPVRNREALDKLSETTDRVRQRNAIAAAFVEPLGLPVDDLFALVIDHPEYYSPDGVHFNAEGIRAQARQVAQAIHSHLPDNTSASAGRVKTGNRVP